LHAESAAASRHRLHADATAHQVHQFAADRKAKSAAGLQPPVVGLLETLEYPRAFFGGHARTIVDHVIGDAIPVAVQFERDAAVGGELQRVVGEVEQDL